MDKQSKESSERGKGRRENEVSILGLMDKQSKVGLRKLGKDEKK